MKEDSGHSSLISLHTLKSPLDPTPLGSLWTLLLITGHQPQPLLRPPPLCGLGPPQPSSLWPRVHAVHFLPLGQPWA